jgi:hypothetical protein
MSDYLLAKRVNHVNRTFNATARSASGSPHWKLDKDTGVYSTNGSVGLYVILDSLSKDEAHFEKQKFFQTMKYHGYTKAKNLGTDFE